MPLSRYRADHRVLPDADADADADAAVAVVQRLTEALGHGDLLAAFSTATRPTCSTAEASAPSCQEVRSARPPRAMAR